MSPDHSARRAEIGRAAMRKRWGPQRVVRLDALDPRVAEAVRALVRADEAARADQARPDPQAA